MFRLYMYAVCPLARVCGIPRVVICPCGICFIVLKGALGLSMVCAVSWGLVLLIRRARWISTIGCSLVSRRKGVGCYACPEEVLHFSKFSLWALLF